MDWVRENWFFLLLILFFVWMHFGHGGHRGCGGHGSHGEEGGEHKGHGVKEGESSAEEKKGGHGCCG